MAAVKEQKHPYIIKKKDMQGGKAIIKGTRIPVSTDGEQLKYAISRGAVLLTPAQHSRNQEDKASGVWQASS